MCDLTDTSWWETYTEPEMHEIIACCFEYAGYHVTNVHEAGASHERGVDLFARKENELIALQVKKKPKASDRAQLRDLSEIDCGRRIYVYVGSPVRTFVDEMKKADIHARVQFWDTKTTLEVLHGMCPYLLTRLMLFHLRAVEIILDMIAKMDPLISKGCKLTADEHRALTRSLPKIKGIPQMIWEAKDFSSSFCKASKYACEILEKQAESGLGDDRPYGLLPQVVDVVENLGTDVLSRPRDSIEWILRDAADSLLRVISAVRQRSVWLYLHSFRDAALELRTGNLSIICRSRADGDLRSCSSESEEQMRGPASSKAVADFLRQLWICASGFEYLIDQLYDSYLNPEFDKGIDVWKSG